MTAYSASPGHPVSNLILAPGDTLSVTSGGTASNDLVGPGSLETVSGIAANETISGATITGTASQPQQLTASLTVAADGTVTGARILNGASLTLFGTASNTTVAGTAPLLVNGQTFTQPTSADVQAGGIATSTTIGSGGDVAIDGTAHGGTVLSGGLLDVFGSADTIVVQTGGNLTVALGQITNTVLSGGTETVLGTEGTGSPLALATQVFTGGVVQLANGGADSGTIIHAGGRETVSAGGNAIAPIINGGTLELATSDGVDGAFTAALFSGAGGTLQIDSTAAPTGTLSGFAPGDRIVFANLPASLSARLSVAGDTVTLTADGATEALTIAGASTLALHLGTDAATGGEAIGVACYCTGTAILTPTGERPVEAIVPGDLVTTTDGRAEPVLWVGRRSYAGRFLAGQPHLLPIRITAGALGHGLPRRDLLVSPCHAMLIGGALVPAGLLTNGQTITQDHQSTTVDYVHLELARHDTILAEGAPSETYLDDDNRALFTNAPHRDAPNDHGPTASGSYCAPRLADGYELEIIRRRLQLFAIAA